MGLVMQPSDSAKKLVTEWTVLIKFSNEKILFCKFTTSILPAAGFDFR